MPLAVVVCGRTVVGKFYIGFPLSEQRLRDKDEPISARSANGAP
jgi:hypothetical protein